MKSSMIMVEILSKKYVFESHFALSLKCFKLWKRVQQNDINLLNPFAYGGGNNWIFFFFFLKAIFAMAANVCLSEICHNELCGQLRLTFFWAILVITAKITVPTKVLYTFRPSSLLMPLTFHQCGFSLWSI